ncbi:MAG: glycosyltransferase family 9 protein [Pirellulales bacterium]
MSDYRHLRILIVRLTAIGDCILTVPVLTALRDQFPRAFIAWAVGRPAAALLEGHAALDELIALPRKWLKSPRQVWALRRRLRALEFDVAIDPQSLTKSSCVSWLSGAHRRIAFGGDYGREFSGLLNNELVYHSEQHIVDRSLELLKPLGIDQPEVRFDLPRYATAEPTINSFLKEHRLGNGFALLNVGAGWPSKVWSPQKFAALASLLRQRHGLTSVISWANDDELMAARCVVTATPNGAVLAEPTSLTELATLARSASVFVSGDTGPLHIAAAVGTPCVGLYGPTRPQDCGPYGAQHLVVQDFYQEGGFRKLPSNNAAMEAIVPDRVADACDTILARTATSAA